LLRVNGRKGFDRFEFHNHLIFHDQIRSESLIEVNPTIGYRNRLLALDVQPNLAQLMGKNDLIDRF